MIRSFHRSLVAGISLALVLTLVGGGQSQEKSPEKQDKSTKPAKLNRDELEKAFAERLSGALAVRPVKFNCHCLQ